MFRPTRINREADPQGQAGGGEAPAAPADEPLVPQSKVDEIITQVTARMHKEAGVRKEELEELRKFKSEHQKAMEQQQQIDMEKKQEYEKLKESWSNRQKELEGALGQKDQAINNLMIENALSVEIMQQNLYPEAKELLKTSAVIEDGQVKIRVKDSNNIESLVSVSDGVKAFREAKPYLARAQNNGGGGTPPSGQGGQGSAGSGKPLVQQMQEARMAGNHKKAEEIKQQIKAGWAEQGISASF